MTHLQPRPMRAGDRMVVERVNNEKENGTFFEAHFTTPYAGQRLIPVEGMRVEICNGKLQNTKAKFEGKFCLVPEGGEIFSIGELQRGVILQVHRDATVQTCCQPYEGWDLYGRILGTLFAAEAVNWSSFEEGRFPTDRAAELIGQRNRFYREILPNAIGNMFLILQRMAHYGHSAESRKMLRFLKQVAGVNFAVVQEQHKIYEEFANLAPDMLVIPGIDK